jgi:signal transduction histidine kinase
MHHRAPDHAASMSTPALALHRLPQRAALVAFVATLCGGALALGALLLLGLWAPSESLGRATLAALVPMVIAGLVAAAAVWWWASHYALQLRDAVDASEQVLADRAERTLMEASQRNAYAAVGDFATELARELAPAVATARASVRSVETALHIDSPLRPPLERAQRELHRLANTMQDTLRLARSGKLSSRRIDLWVPLRNALRAAAAEASARNIWLEPPPFGRTPVWINGDEEALEQLFLNLLLNAVQETEAGGRVSAIVTLGDDAVVSVTDTGRGIPQDALDRVFEPFYSTKPEGAGLGLAIAWRTAAAHGGRLMIESAVGRGTTVDVALPRADSASELRLAE